MIRRYLRGPGLNFFEGMCKNPQDGIQAGTLNWHSSVAVAVMEVTAQNKIPHIFGFGATEVVNETFTSDPEKYGYWSTKGWPTPAKLGYQYIDALEYYIDKGVYSPETKTVAILDEDTDWSRSFATSMQVATGCTFGKGNIQKLGYVKCGLTLIDRKQNKAERVAPRSEVMAENKKTEFMAKRKAGIPPTMIPDEILQSLVNRVLNLPAEQLYTISEIFNYTWEAAPDQDT